MLSVFIHQKLFILSEAIAALYEFVALDKAIGEARKMINIDETLLMVSADHGHVFSIGTYGRRGADLFSVGTKSATRQRWSRNGTDEENTFIGSISFRINYL